MVIKGYFIICLYVFTILVLLAPLIKKLTNGEVSRKFVHISIFLVWCFLEIFFRNTIHQIIIPIMFLLINILSYKYKIFKSIEREGEKSYGTIYFALAICIIMTIVYFYPKYFYCSGLAVFCLTFGDGLAALGGMLVKSPKIYENKTIAGFITCLLASFLAIIVFNLYYHLNLSLLMIFLISLGVAIFELVGNGLDNITVVLASFIMSILFISIPSHLLELSILLAEVIFMTVFLSHSISYLGSLLSMVISFCFLYFGGLIGISVLLLEFFTLYILDLIKKKEYQIRKKEKKPRNALQIIINSSLGTIFIILYGLLHNNVYLIISIISLSGCFIDSISSDVGTLSKKDPIDLLRWKKVPKGISGGVSFLGTISSLIVAIIIAFIVYLVLNLNISDLIIISLLIFSQTILDSLMGSAFQTKYVCSKCHKVSDHEICCEERTKKISGISWMDNNAVNAIASIIVTILAMIVYL